MHSGHGNGQQYWQSLMDSHRLYHAAPRGKQEGVFSMLDRICLTLVIIGALNWGGIGLFRFDTVAWICGGQGTIVARIIYTLVALAGIWCISLLFREEAPASEHHA